MLRKRKNKFYNEKAKIIARVLSGVTDGGEGENVSLAAQKWAPF